MRVSTCSFEDTWNKPARRFGQRFFEFIVPIEATATASRLYDAAELCSRLAKLGTGPTRQSLYRQKNMCLRMLICEFSQEVQIRGDHARYPGLLIIRLNTSTHSGLHTHENWLLAA